METPVAPEADAFADRETVELTAAQVKKALGDGFDSEPTRPGVPMPIDMPDKIPELLLARIPANEAPFVLLTGAGDSAASLRADLKHTRYVLGSDPTRGEKNQIEVQLDGHRISPNHAEIFLGRKVGEEDYQWFLAPHPDSEHQVYVDGYRALKADERVALTPGRLFALGDQKGERGGIQFTFDIPWLKGAATNSGEPRPASVFPKEFVSHLGEDQPTMALRSNFGSFVLQGDRKITRYILGSGVAKPAAKNVAFHQLPGDKIAPEHAEIFVDAAGQWYFKVLSDTHPTYFRNKQAEAGSVFALQVGDPIELGGDPKNGVGLAVLFYKPEYGKSGRDSSQPKVERGPDSDPGEPVSARELLSPAGLPEDHAESDLAKTVVPPPKPPPLPPPRRASPPPPPDGPVPLVPRMTPPPLPEAPPAGAKSEGELKTGVFPVRSDLLAASALGDVEPEPATVQAGRIPPPPEAGSPKAKSVPPPPPKPEPEESFAGMAEEVNAQGDQGDGIVTMNAWENPPRQVSVADRPTPVPPPPAVEPAVEPVSPLAADLAVWHPGLTNPAILEILRPILLPDREAFKAQLEGLKHFPQILAGPSKLLRGSTQGSGEAFSFFTKLTGYDVGFESGKGDPGAPIPTTLKDKLFELVGLYYLAGKFKHTYRMESDRVNLKFSAFEEKDKAPTNTVASLPLKQGSESQAFEGIFEHFLTLGVPVEVVAPLNAQGMKRPYIGVFYRAEDAAAVHAALEAFVAKRADILAAEHQMPFSHPIVDATGMVLPGVGIMEHASDGVKANLLEVRSYAIAKGYGKATAEAKGRNSESIDPQVFLKEVLKAFDEKGFDLNNPGFLKGSPEGSHRFILGGDPAP